MKRSSCEGAKQLRIESEMKGVVREAVTAFI
jgi:hypothetical protein